MALEDLAMMRAVQGSSVFYPSDARQRRRAGRRDGRHRRASPICARRAARIRCCTTTASPFRSAARRSCAPVHRDAGHADRCRASPLHECLRAADQLALDGIHARVIDLLLDQADRRRHAGRGRGCHGRPGRRRRGPPSRGRSRLGRSSRAAQGGSPAAPPGAPERVRAAWLGHDRRATGRRRH